MCDDDGTRMHSQHRHPKPHATVVPKLQPYTHLAPARRLGGGRRGTWYEMIGWMTDSVGFSVHLSVTASSNSTHATQVQRQPKDFVKELLLSGGASVAGVRAVAEHRAVAQRQYGGRRVTTAATATTTTPATHPQPQRALGGGPNFEP